MNIVLQSLKEKFGSQTEIARQFGVYQSAINQWIDKNKIPADRALRASELTGIPADEILRENERCKDRSAA